jgi:hypothetical protein
MPHDLAPTLLNRINQNITALGRAIEEVAVWIDQRGSADVSDRIDDHLEVIAVNAEFIAKAIVELMAGSKPQEEESPKN